jgi:nucleoside-diphosphate-sugar epimerase
MPRWNRRQFLGGVGVALAGARQGTPASQPKRLLITSAHSRLAQSLASALQDKYQVRLTERVPVRTGFEFLPCALDRDPATNLLVRGTDGIVHVAEPLPDETEKQQLDYLACGTHNLLWAALEERVPRLVFLSTLELMTAYEPNFTVNESWAPRPTCDTPALSKHLGEFTCREVAREGKISIVVLRLGKVVRLQDVTGKPFDPLWVEERDVAQAVTAALTAKFPDTVSRLSGWSIFHIGADGPRARFSAGRAKSELAYRPQFNW